MIKRRRMLSLVGGAAAAKPALSEAEVAAGVVQPLIRLRHPFDSAPRRSGQALLPSLRGEGRLRHACLERPSPRDSGERVPKEGEGPLLVLDSRPLGLKVRRPTFA